MSTRGSLVYKTWPEKCKSFNRFGLRKEFTLHIYHQCLNDGIYLEIIVFGKTLFDMKLPFIEMGLYGIRHK